MKRRFLFFAQAILLVLVAALAGSAIGRLAPELRGMTAEAAAINVTPLTPLAPVGSGFTYQGRLKDGGNPADGQYDFTFKLYDSLSGGIQVSGTLTLLNQTVANGLFTVQLDFGTQAFQGQARWLEIAARTAGGGGYTTLSPRQPLTPTPYAASLMPGAAITAILDGPVLQVTNNNPSPFATPVALSGSSSMGDGVRGSSTNSNGVYGTSSGGEGSGVYGYNNGNGNGVLGSAIPTGYGVKGTSTLGWGVYGTSNNGGVWGSSTGSGYGVYGEAFNAGFAVFGSNNNASGWAGYFSGRVQVNGTLSKSAGSFKIDHPLDPANKYLYHSFVESPDMKNIYDGNVTTNSEGEAVVELPDWFEALNKDFRYQLTIMGEQFAQARVSSEIKGNRFAIKTDKPNIKVSWQVTGIRKDAYAEAHRIPVEEEKQESEQGKYLHPVELGQPVTKGIDYGRVEPVQQSKP